MVLFYMSFCEVSQVCLLVFSNLLVLKETISLYAGHWISMYRNDPKFSDRYAWANSADPDQTAPRGAV